MQSAAPESTARSQKRASTEHNDSQQILEAVASSSKLLIKVGDRWLSRGRWRATDSVAIYPLNQARRYGRIVVQRFRQSDRVLERDPV